MSVAVKICGLTDPESVNAAVNYGADYIGLVFFPPSPRNIPLDLAGHLAGLAPSTVQKVGLFVDPEDGLIDAVVNAVALDVIQLHGDEPPERCAELASRTQKQIFKALKVRAPGDLAAADIYAKTCTGLLFDAKPPENATRPGGNAETFDWTILEGRTWPVQWFLAGGLTPANVKTGIRTTGCPAVDTSSGVESTPGQKDQGLIRRFIKAAKSA